MDIPFNPEKARECYSGAHLFYKSGRLADALALLKEIINKYEPHNVEAHLLAARIYIRSRQAASAIKIIDHLHNFEQPKPESLAIQAKAELQKDLFSECEKTLKILENVQRNYLEGLVIKGELLLRTNQLEPALKLYKALREREQGNPEILYGLALGHYLAGQHHQAVSYCDALLKARPGNLKVRRIFDRCILALKKEIMEKEKITFWTNPFKWFKYQVHDAEIINKLTFESIQVAKDESHSEEVLYDSLTGVLNNRAAMSYIPGFYAKRTGDNKLFIGYVDADHFKSFNDCFSHDVGDQVLIALARVGEKCFPKRFFRLHGEECLWAYEGREDLALHVAEEFRASVENNAFREANDLIVQKNYRFPENHPRAGEFMTLDWPITISQGVVVYGEDGNSFETIQTEADNNLMMAKQTGRNCVFFRGALKTRGETPIHYTKDLINELNALGEKRGFKNWFDYMRTLDKKNRAIMVETAKNAVRNAVINSSS